LYCTAAKRKVKSWWDVFLFFFFFLCWWFHLLTLRLGQAAGSNS
jgi:cbb3-type cytochrome oxidase subunit 3